MPSMYRQQGHLYRVYIICYAGNYYRHPKNTELNCTAHVSVQQNTNDAGLLFSVENCLIQVHR